jgi:glycine/D-amino acid oxidase-like deaminating enzyme
MKSIAIFGAGIAGLSAAHECSKLGYEVTVYEANADAGGFFRSARTAEDESMPSEYSWHGFGPWYHNVFDAMKQIPFDDATSVYDKSLSRPINYSVLPDTIIGKSNEDALYSMVGKLRLTWLDRIRWSVLLLKTWTSNRRTEERYALQNASEAWRPIMSDLGWRTWRATFGPWVGADWTRASLHHVGQFFRHNLISGPKHEHKADDQGEAWTQGSGGGWLVLRGPSNEYFIDKWVAHLKKVGVKFLFKKSLQRLDFDGKSITAAHVESGEKIQADVYVVAVNPFAAADVFERTPALAKLDELRLFKPLTGDGPHTQVSFRVAFNEKIAWPRDHTAVLLADSEFNITLFAEEQSFAPGVSLGDGVKSLWTGTACVGTVPGRVHGHPPTNCTKEQFIDEVRDQILRAEGLDYMVKKANGGRGLKDFPIQKIEVWHEWRFSPKGIQPRQPKWVMSSTTQPYLPNQKTPVPNLVLAGAHTKVQADIWSIEGAVESGRRAAKVIDPNVRVISQFKPVWLRAIAAIDDGCFALGLPHVVDLLIIVAFVVAIIAVGAFLI